MAHKLWCQYSGSLLLKYIAAVIYLYGSLLTNAAFEEVIISRRYYSEFHRMQESSYLKANDFFHTV